MSDPAHRTFVSYIDKSREYYASKGFDAPYRWATHPDAPYARLTKPLSEARVGIVTTTKRTEDDSLRPFAAATDPAPEEMYTNHLFWHKKATTTDDLGSYLPIAQLNTVADQGRIGSLAPRFYGAATVYSQRRTLKDAQQILAWCREDDVDLVLLIPL